LAIAKSGEGRLHLHRAAALLAHAKDSIEKTRPELNRVTIAGDFRRGCELVGDLAFVAEAAKPDKTSTPSADGLQIRVSDRTSVPPFSSPPASVPSSSFKPWPPRRGCG
jgi:DNA polymerase (family 10)